MTKRKVFHIVSALLLVLSVIYLIFPGRLSLLRSGEMFRDLWQSLCAYFQNLFGGKGYSAVSEPSAFLKPSSVLPLTWEECKAVFSAYPKAFFSRENFVMYSASVFGSIHGLLLFLCIVLPVFPLLFLCVKLMGKKTVVCEGEARDSRWLRKCRRLKVRVFQPVGRTLREYFDFFGSGWYFKGFLFIWLLVFNVVTIAGEAIAYYLWFAASFSLSDFYVQFYKLALDLALLLQAVPSRVLIVLALLVFDRFRKNVAYRILEHCEAENRALLEKKPVVTLRTGPMGVGKTRILVDMALTVSTIFRDKAFAIMQKVQLQFPAFPWIEFQRDITAGYKEHSIVKLEDCRKFVNALSKGDLYGYAGMNAPMYYDNGLSVSSLTDALEMYAQAFFIYSFESSLLVGNLSVREDDALVTIGNLPLWQRDFFGRTAGEDHYSHILDFDALRLGKTMQQDNPMTGALEFGVVLITEMGKERGNQLTLQGKKESDEKCNPKNDFFDRWLKMSRHTATVDGYPFIRVLGDDQRAESLGADTRELADIEHIRACGSLRCKLPFFFFDELVHDLFFSWYTPYKTDRDYRRSDNTVFSRAVDLIAGKLDGYYRRRLNRFGSMIAEIEVESGKLDGETVTYKYYLSAKKIYSKRYSTDCYRDLFAQRSERTPLGLGDMPTYSGVCATAEELTAQHSHFFEDLRQKIHIENNEEQEEK